MSNSKYERILPLSTTPYFFIGKKPIAVIFGEERIDLVTTWTQVYALILERCNQNPKHHEMLMYLRHRAGGKVREFLSSSPAKMRRPVKIDENLYGESHYGSETLIHILCKRILDPVHYDYSEVKVVIKEGS